jgi:hypothetical protein
VLVFGAFPSDVGIAEGSVTDSYIEFHKRLTQILCDDTVTDGETLASTQVFNFVKNPPPPSNSDPYVPENTADENNLCLL